MRAKKVCVMPTQSKTSTSSPKQARCIGWSSVIVALVLGYIFWIISKQWWTPSVVIFGALFLSICVGNCYLATKTKAYDLYLAAVLSLAAPLIVIFFAFGFFFSGPTP